MTLPGDVLKAAIVQVDTEVVAFVEAGLAEEPEVLAGALGALNTIRCAHGLRFT